MATGLAPALVGIIGALASVMLWLRQVTPNGPVTRFLAEHVLAGAQNWDGLIVVATIAGGIVLLMAILSSIGSRAGAVVGFVLAVIALSYPFAYLAQLVARPFTSGFLR